MRNPRPIYGRWEPSRGNRYYMEDAVSKNGLVARKSALMRTSMFAFAGFVAVAAGCGDDNNVPDAPKVDAQMIDADLRPDAMLTMSPLTADFGTVVQNATSSTMTFTVTNSGGKPSGAISATLMGSGASNFAVESNGCTTLAVAATCTVTVSFTPTSAGAKSASLAVSATPGGSISAALDGTGLPPGAVTITPTSNAFADTVVGSTSASSSTFTVKNTGGTTTSALSIQVSGSNPNDFVKATDGCDGMTLAAQATCTFTVSFKPQTSGAKSATYTVAAGTATPAQATVTGNGIPPAQLAVAPTLQDFGTVLTGQSSNIVTFTVTNAGGVATGAITQTLGGADASQFSVASSSCSGATVAAGATCTVGIKFSPTSGGSKAATLTFTATPGGTVSATLLGAGNPPGSLSANPTTLTFANTTVGQTSASQSVTITNNGGAATSALTTSLGGNDPGQFQIVAGSNGCAGTVLAAGATCTIAIDFAPSTGGAKSASLSVSAGTSTTSVGLAGNAIPDAHFTIVPTSHDFGAVGTGSQSGFFTFTVTNDGGQTSGAPTAALGGVNATQFILQNGCTAALAPNASCTVQVKFAPNIDNSNAQATVSVSATPGGTATAQVFGQAVPPAALSAVPTSVDFNADAMSNNGFTLIGDTTVKTITVSNSGTEPTGTINITKSGTNAADYTFTTNCTTLPSMMTCTITVTFAPTATGLETASLLVSASPGGNTSIALHGDSLPRLQITAPATNPFQFDPTIVNVDPTAAPTQQVTFKNNTSSSQPLTVAALTDTTNFSVSATTCTANLAAGASCSATVKFIPTTTGAKTTDLKASIGAGAANSATETLNGTGINSLTISATTQNGVTCSGTVPSVSCNFGNVAIGALSGTLTVTVQNPSGAPSANSISTTLSNSDYQILSDNCAGSSLAGNSTCQIQIRLAPTGTPGARNGTLTVTASPAGGSATLNLTGQAVTGAAVTVNPADTLAFGNVISGDSSTQTITLTNTGGAPSGVITITPPAAGSAFSIVATMGDCVSGTTVLAASGSAGNSCVVHVKYAPTGAPSAQVAVTPASITFAAAGFTGLPAGGVTVALTGTESSAITSSPATSAIGNVAVGSQTQKTFTISNTSAHAVTVTTSVIVGAPAETTIVSNNCATLAATTGTCMIVVQFAPTVAGDYSRVLQVNSATGTAVSTITAHANTAASLSWSPSTTVDLGSALAAATNGGSATFTLKNAGETASPVAVSITDTTDYTLTTTCTASLAALSSCTATVKFTPPAGATAGAKPATIHSGVAGVDATVTATVVVTGDVLVTPAQQDFGSLSIGATSTAQSFTLQNSNTSTATLTIATTGDFALSATGTTCGATLAAGASCVQNVTFTPTMAGFRSGRLNTGNNGYAALSGTGIGNAHLQIEGSANGTAVSCAADCTALHAFGSVATGDSSTFTYIITNTGGQAAAAISTSIDGNDPSSFALTSDGCNGKALAAGASCKTSVSFQPQGVGSKTATVHFNSTTATAPYAIPLSGTGVLQAILGITPSANPQSAGTSPVDKAGTIVTFAIHNGGDVSLSSGLVIKLSNTKDFDLVTAATTPCSQGQILASGDTCNVAVQFDPETIGADTTTLTVSGGAGTGTTTVSNVINGTGTSSITVNPATFGFATITHGNMGAAHSFVFTNNADNSTGVLHTTLGGADAGSFSVVTDGCSGTTVAAGGMCTISVRFSPQTAGMKNATLTVDGGAGGSPSAALSGTAN